MSVSYVGRLTRPTLSADTWQILLSTTRPTLGRYSTDISADTRPTYSTLKLDRHLGSHSTDTRPISRLILERHPGRHSAEISTETWSSVGRRVLQVGKPSVATIGRYLVGLTDYTRPTPRPLGYDDRYSIDTSADTRPILDRPLGRHRQSADSVDRYSTDTIGGHSANISRCRLILDQHYRRTLVRYLGRCSTDISADTRARY